MKQFKPCMMLPAILLALVMAASCKSAPPAPSQDDLDQMNAAMKRAATARQAATDVQGSVYFPDEWNKAQSDEANGRKADKAVAEAVKNATVSFTSAAEGYESIAEKSAPLYAKDLEESRAALNAAKAGADKARQGAADLVADRYSPDEWEDAQAKYQSAVDSPTATLADIKAATANFTAAADAYNAAAAKSRPLFALDSAISRAEASRKQALASEADTSFPNEWKAADAKHTQAKNAPLSEDKVDDAVLYTQAAALYNQAADAYDDIAKKSAQKLAKELDDSQKALNAAIARADKSRKSAQDAKAEANFPNEWKAADAKHTQAKNAPLSEDKVKPAASYAQAAALYNQAADAYDDIAKKSSAMAKEMDDNMKLLNAAVARLEKSRKDATAANGQANFPAEWKAAEAKNTAATGAKRGTVAEVKAAVPLYNSAADAYDDIVKKANSGSVDTATAAKTKAEKERQTALDIKANVAAANDFNAADKLFQQAVKDFTAKTYGPATDNYNKAAAQFATANAATMKKRDQAKDAIDKAQQKSTASAAFAADTGRKMEGQ